MSKNEKKSKSTKTVISIIIIILGILLILLGLFRCGRDEEVGKPADGNKDNIESIDETGKIEIGEEVMDEDGVSVAGPDEDMDEQDGAFEDPFDEEINPEGSKSSGSSDNQPNTEDGSNDNGDNGNEDDSESVSKPVGEVEEKEPEETEQTTNKYGGLY